MDFDDLRALMEKRTSVRSFSPKKVDKKLIEKIVDSSTLVPSIDNTQPWRFHIITDEKIKQELMEVSCYGNFVTEASAFVVVTCDRAAKGSGHQDSCTIWNPKEMEYSCASAMYAMMLAATAEGIGSCWVSLHHGPAHNILKLKDHQVIVGGVMLGYALENSEPSHDRQPLTEIVRWYE